MPHHPKSINITGFKGLNNVGSPENTAQEYLKKALNVDIDKTGNISKRKGYILKDAGNYSSLWSNERGDMCYAVKDGNLVRINHNYSTTLIRANVGALELSFDDVDGSVYYSSTETNGVIDPHRGYRSWGIPKNTLSPTLSVTTGNMPVGTYQVSFTWVDVEGRESGTGVASTIDLTEQAGISLFIPSNNNPDILLANIYCSTPDGNTLYFSGYSQLNRNYTISSISNLINPLRTFGIDSAPLGHIVRYYKGRLYIAQDNILWYSEPFQYDLFRLNSNYIEFPEKIREVMPVDDGIWVGSDYLYYLYGSEPAQFKRSLKEYISIVPGTSTKISGSYIHMDNTPIGYKWLVTSDIGIFLLFNQGMCINTTSQNIALEQADSGTSVFLQDEGRNQYLSILKTNQNPNNSVIGDLVEATIVRNGVTIPQ